MIASQVWFKTPLGLSESRSHFLLLFVNFQSSHSWFLMYYLIFKIVKNASKSCTNFLFEINFKIELRSPLYLVCSGQDHKCLLQSSELSNHYFPNWVRPKHRTSSQPKLILTRTLWSLWCICVDHRSSTTNWPNIQFVFVKMSIKFSKVLKPASDYLYNSTYLQFIIELKIYSTHVQI